MQAPATYIAPAMPTSALESPRPVPSGLRAADIDPTMVTSSPSRIQTVPRPMTTIQCHRAHGSRSIRAGMSVVMVPVSTPAMSRDARPVVRAEHTPAGERPREGSERQKSKPSNPSNMPPMPSPMPPNMSPMPSPIAPMPSPRPSKPPPNSMPMNIQSIGPKPPK